MSKDICLITTERSCDKYLRSPGYITRGVNSIVKRRIVIGWEKTAEAYQPIGI